MSQQLSYLWGHGRWRAVFLAACGATGLCVLAAPGGSSPPRPSLGAPINAPASSGSAAPSQGAPGSTPTLYEREVASLCRQALDASQLGWVTWTDAYRTLYGRGIRLVNECRAVLNLPESEAGRHPGPPPTTASAPSSSAASGQAPAPASAPQSQPVPPTPAPPRPVTPQASPSVSLDQLQLPTGDDFGRRRNR